MEKKFGETLKHFMKLSGVKERELADFINYDITSISKWVNGAKLPSNRNGEEIIEALAKCLAERGRDKLEKRKVEEGLRTAWKQDLAYQELQVQSSDTLSFLDDRKDFFELLKRVLKKIEC